MNGMCRPIFIGGLSGSGKTHVRRILGAHPSVCMTRKSYLWTRYYGKFGDLANHVRFERCLSAIVADRNAQQLRPDPQKLRREFRDGPATYARLFGLVHTHHAERMGCTRWGEQLGMVERFAAPIFADFPDARMLHMIRHPAHKQHRASTTFGKAIRLGPEIARWLRSVELAQRNSRRFPDRYRVVRYEELASQPLETTIELCAFLGLELVPKIERVLWSALGATTSTGECDR